MNDNIKAVIFDLDGTLFDSCSMWNDIDRLFFKRRGMEIPENFNKLIAPLGMSKAAKFVRETYNIDNTEEEIKKEWHDLAIFEYENNVNLKDNAEKFLKYLEKKNIKMAIATANGKEYYMPCLKRHKIEKYFDYICDVEEFSGSKKTPDIYLHCAKKLGLNPNEIAVIEDIPEAIKSAKLGGFYVIAIDDETEKNLREEKKYLADEFIYSFSELIK